MSLSLLSLLLTQLFLAQVSQPKSRHELTRELSTGPKADTEGPQSLIHHLELKVGDPESKCGIQLKIHFSMLT
jgi:hypothetical protein